MATNFDEIINTKPHIQHLFDKAIEVNKQRKIKGYRRDIYDNPTKMRAKCIDFLSRHFADRTNGKWIFYKNKKGRTLKEFNQLLPIQFNKSKWHYNNDMVSTSSLTFKSGMCSKDLFHSALSILPKAIFEIILSYHGFYNGFSDLNDIIALHLLNYLKYYK